jgi:hypothetical protein
MTNELEIKAQNAGLVKAKSNLPEGMEGIGDSELSIGAAVLVQAMTSVFVSQGIAPGSIVNSATGKVLETNEFVPAFMTKRWFLYDNSGSMPKFVAASGNENDPIFNGKIRFNTITKEQRAAKIKPEVLPVIYVVAINNGQPLKLAFKKASGYKAGQDLYTLARKAGVALWGQKYKIGSKLIPSTNGNPPFYALTVEVVGPASEGEQLFAKQLNQAFQAKPVVEESEEAPF